MGRFYDIDAKTIENLEITESEQEAFDTIQEIIPHWFLSEDPHFQKVDNNLLVSWEKDRHMISFMIYNEAEPQFHWLTSYDNEGNVISNHASLSHILNNPAEYGLIFSIEELTFSERVLQPNSSERDIAYFNAKLRAFLTEETENLVCKFKTSEYTTNATAVVLELGLALLGKEGINDLRVALDRLEEHGFNMNTYYDSLK